MVQMSQGEVYEEEDAVNDSDVTEESEESTSNMPDTIYGIPRHKFLILAAAAVLIVIILFVWLKTTQSSDTSNSDILEPDQISDESWEALLDDPVPEETVDDVSAEQETVGTAEIPVQDTAPVEAVSLASISTDDQILLRKYGYSGDEITYALQHGFSVDALIAASQELYDTAAYESIVRMSDEFSPEFQYLLEYSYLGQEEQELVPQSTLPAEERVAYVEEVTINTDYTKCPVRGYQLYLKCRLQDNHYFWLEVEPQRYCELPESGNIVLTVQYSHYGNSVFVTNAYESNNNVTTIDTSGN